MLPVTPSLHCKTTGRSVSNACKPWRKARQGPRVHRGSDAAIAATIEFTGVIMTDPRNDDVRDSVHQTYMQGEHAKPGKAVGSMDVIGWG
ncbi:hypothetical protein sS8_0502 [Methylocaldum marinum]|uniref:Uncharacterized protein n=1 Tax=Methylocaldum marinum TaxID=1432792 RepID=A0A250KLM2_9GAMM|nr:hypothetical protein sS8_0502 [Methylocaldum marinum]